MSEKARDLCYEASSFGRERESSLFIHNIAESSSWLMQQYMTNLGYIPGRVLGLLGVFALPGGSASNRPANNRPAMLMTIRILHHPFACSLPCQGKERKAESQSQCGTQAAWLKLDPGALQRFRGSTVPLQVSKVSTAHQQEDEKFREGFETTHHTSQSIRL